MEKKTLTKEQALQKLKQYCAYQERSHFDAKQKLWELGIKPNDHDEIVAALIEGDYLNEERFAKQFAGGKFRMKSWGRKKIEHELKKKQVSPYLIKIALKEIKEDVYGERLAKLAREKYRSLKGEQYLVRKKKTMNYLLQKGFEQHLVLSILNSLTNVVN